MSLALIPKDLLKRIPSEGKFATNRRQQDLPFQQFRSRLVRVQRRFEHSSDSLLRLTQSTPCAYGTTRSRRPRAKQLAQGSIPSPIIRADDDTVRPSYPTVVQQARNNINKFENCVVLTRVGSFYEVRVLKIYLISFI